jgi:hypothetical protein
MKEALKYYIHTWQAVQEVEIMPQRDESQEDVVIKRWAFLKGAGERI